MKNALIGLVFAVALSGVLSDDFPSNSVNTKNSEIFSYLPNEFPKLSAMYTIYSPSQQKALQSLEKIIGYLPLADQRLLFNSLNSFSSSGPVFDYSKYSSTSTNQIFQNEKDALVEYINQNAKRLPKGLSCLIKVVNTFSHDSFEDKELLKSIYTNIDNVIKAQENAATCQINFMDTLFNVGLQRRQYLMEKVYYENNDGLNPNSVLLTDEKGDYYNVKYPPNLVPLAETPTIISEFKKFASCQQYYNHEITRNIIESEISISQLKKCFNENEYNPDAGKSSDKVVISSINYHKKKVIGINEGNGTRSDQRTQTNHTLNYGFNLGKTSLALNAKKQITHKYTINAEWNTIINEINSTLLTGIESKIPFSNLHNLLITYGSPTPTISSSCLQEIELNTNNLNSCQNTSPFISTFNPFLIASYTVSSSTLSLYKKNSKTLLYSEATIDGKEYYDIYYDGKSIGQEYSETSTACISSFGSGGKNDKDACRDVMKTKCGNEIDFRCKQSNLYDLLNEIPIASYSIPPACLGYVSSAIDSTITAQVACLNWIDDKFMLGGIIPKPSQFITYGLTAQSDANDYIEDTSGYIKKYATTSLTSSNSLIGNQIAIPNPTLNTVNSIEFKHAMDESYAIMVDSAHFNSTSLFFLFLIFILF